MTPGQDLLNGQGSLTYEPCLDSILSGIALAR